MIAQVIVDLATQATDRIFEYHIPEELSDVTVGSRVYVPFGRRKLQGFVVGITDKSSFTGKLKDIEIVVDEQAPLTPELVSLSQDIAYRNFSYRINILLAMLPRAMRANYKKLLIQENQEPIEITTKTNSEDLKHYQKLLKQGLAKIEYVIEDQVKTKQTIEYALTLSKSEYEKLPIRKNALQQKQLLADILADFEHYPKIASALAMIPTPTLKTFVKKGWLKATNQEVYRKPDLPVEVKKSIVPNDEQANAIEKITQASLAKSDQEFLLEGVTGSGKTEVYLNVMEKVLKSGKNALMLVPEISLTPQMVSQVKGRFGEQTAVLHSGLSVGERYDEWRRIRRGEVKVVIGARSAIFAPLDNLGVIIIDEEHESSYKQEENPRYHARDVAKWRAHFHHCPVVLGSATPSLNSRARAQKGVYELIKLTKRANQKALPEAKIIDLKRTMFAGGQFDLSLELLDLIKDRLAKKEQTILLFNRRGFANFLLCRECGYVLTCPNCDLSLTMHRATNAMECHYCGHKESIPKRCPKCQSQKLRFMGSGTEKVAEELTELVPELRILRMDVDTTRRKGSYQRILDAFANHEADLLLGTQMIAKGLDFPNVTLVGVINADTSLWIPNFNASERTFQLLTQVAGRAGRAEKTGQVIIQTYNPDHYAISLAQKQDYENFYQNEMKMRYVGKYQPFYFTTLVTVSSKDRTQAAKTAFQVRRRLSILKDSQTIILGPTPSAISRIKNQYYYQILVKYKKEPKLFDLLHQIQDDSQKLQKAGIFVAIDNEPERIM
ncbi:MAG: primosomal protein N' [Lactobacillus sp.]|nr:primosomal protein N' [Lactobacillus sp.]